MVVGTHCAICATCASRARASCAARAAASLAPSNWPNCCCARAASSRNCALLVNCQTFAIILFIAGHANPWVCKKCAWHT